MTVRSYTVHRVATDDRAYRELVETVRAEPNGEIEDLEHTIAAYETKYGLTSADARVALARGELSPDLEIEGWMMAVKLRDHLAGVKARAR